MEIHLNVGADWAVPTEVDKTVVSWWTDGVMYSCTLEELEAHLERNRVQALHRGAD